MVNLSNFTDITNSNLEKLKSYGDKAEDRCLWIWETLTGNPSGDYALSFCEKILPGFLQNGIILKSRLKYVSIFCHYDDRKKIREILRSLGIKHRAYWVDISFEILVREEDYNLYRLSYPNGDFDCDTNIKELNETWSKRCLNLSS